MLCSPFRNRHCSFYETGNVCRTKAWREYFGTISQNSGTFAQFSLQRFADSLQLEKRLEKNETYQFILDLVRSTGIGKKEKLLVRYIALNL